MKTHFPPLHATSVSDVSFWTMSLLIMPTADADSSGFFSGSAAVCGAPLNNGEPFLLPPDVIQ